VIDALIGKTTSDKIVLDLKYQVLDSYALPSCFLCIGLTIHSRIFGLGLFRGSLFTELNSVMQKEHIPVHSGVEVLDIHQLPNGKVRLLFSTGEKSDEYDLAVVADGARSALR